MDSPDTFTSHGVEFDRSPEKCGWLTESSDMRDDGAALRARMTQDGYLFIRGSLDREVVTDARREILERLASVDEIDTSSHPLMDAVASGRSTRGKLPDTRAFGNDLRNGPALTRLVHEGDVISFYETFLGGEVRPFDHIWLRNVRVGGATGCHYDVVYMGRGTHDLYTSWIPIGDVPYSDGALMVLENSHTHQDLREGYGAVDVDSGKPNPWGGGWFSRNPVEVQDQFGGRWLTADDGGFRLGDLLVFGMFTMHCSLDNVSPVNRIRITSDTRYQLASEPADERWVGDDPIGHDINKRPA
ncbi:phytanoyl-CoA dioxygenase [Candidatus Poribacteria bacterium]|nr:phytanoyl-CoA dioxygenase [Candidatus Poribacteria bacterium]